MSVPVPPSSVFSYLNLRSSSAQRLRLKLAVRRAAVARLSLLLSGTVSRSTGPDGSTPSFSCRSSTSSVTAVKTCSRHTCRVGVYSIPISDFAANCGFSVDAKGFSAHDASIATIIGNCGAIFGGFVTGYVSQFLGRRFTIILCCLWTGKSTADVVVRRSLTHQR